MNDYKIEVKPTYWDVELSYGSYSDYEEAHLYFAGNDENEIWNFLCRYVKSQDYDENDFVGVENPLAMKWNDKAFSRYILSDYDYFYNFDYVNVEIKRLKVIYFKK